MLVTPKSPMNAPSRFSEKLAAAVPPDSQLLLDQLSFGVATPALQNWSTLQELKYVWVRGRGGGRPGGEVRKGAGVWREWGGLAGRVRVAGW